MWLAEVFVAVAIAAPAAATKARRANSSLFSGPGRKFVLSFAPPIVVGGFLTLALFQLGDFAAPAGSVAAAVWNGDCHGRSIFRARGADHGSLPDGAWRSGIICPGTLGKPIHGRGFRSSADRFRFVDRFATRRLSEFWRTEELWRDHRQSGRCACKKRKAPRRSRARGARPVPANLDRLIHERIRLGIVSALAVNRSLTFNELKALLKTTDGNLSVHARKLEEADYIVCTKSFDGRLPKTEYRLTAGGRRALERYLNHMEALIRATREG